MDTAGGCEEVVAVSSGIRTGARTGVELNKKGLADEAAENIRWADGTAEGKNWWAGPLKAKNWQKGLLLNK